jgi:hypothetical protein
MQSVGNKLGAVTRGVPALFAVLGLVAEARAQNAAVAPNRNQAVARAALRFQEAQSLRQAYLALASANHDYDGHRVKAMIAVKGALKALDEVVMNNGTAEQKAATTQGQAAVANAGAGAKQTPTVHEKQTNSDEVLQQAAQTLQQVRATMITNKQRKNLVNHIDTALSEIAMALKIR